MKGKFHALKSKWGACIVYYEQELYVHNYETARKVQQLMHVPDVPIWASASRYAQSCLRMNMPQWRLLTLWAPAFANWTILLDKLVLQIHHYVQSLTQDSLQGCIFSLTFTAQRAWLVQRLARGLLSSLDIRAPIRCHLYVPVTWTLAQLHQRHQVTWSWHCMSCKPALDCKAIWLRQIYFVEILAENYYHYFRCGRWLLDNAKRLQQSTAWVYPSLCTVVSCRDSFFRMLSDRTGDPESL